MFSIFTNVTKYKEKMSTRDKLDNAKDATKKMRKNCKKRIKKKKTTFCRDGTSTTLITICPMS